jgi:hypothetical protein
MFVLVLLSFFRAAYTLYLYSYSQHGSVYSGLYSCSLGYVREFLLLFFHWLPLNLIILRLFLLSIVQHVLGYSYAVIRHRVKLS